MFFEQIRRWILHHYFAVHSFAAMSLAVSIYTYKHHYVRNHRSRRESRARLSLLAISHLEDLSFILAVFFAWSQHPKRDAREDLLRPYGNRYLYVGSRLSERREERKILRGGTRQTETVVIVVITVREGERTGEGVVPRRIGKVMVIGLRKKREFDCACLLNC